MKETVKHFFVREKGTPINVETTGISICDPNQSHLRNKPGMVIIEYVFEGEGTIYIDGKKLEVKTDDIYILPSGISHEYRAHHKNPWSKYFMNLTGSLAESLLASFSLNNQYVFSAPSLKGCFSEIIRVSFADMPEAIKQSKLASIYVEILHRLHQLNKESQKSSEAVSLKTYLDENYNRVISNKELASQIYRSPDYCLKLFKREFGTTPYDYQMNNKIRIARSLLHHTKNSISEIAEFIGYENPHYFASMFKTKVGVTPSEYRKKFL
ncbi:MAG: AraC family transcriptional regulator [Clostridia bacterium]|nr:AraC family transcriptional regulator [Clostridia bacterium]